ncbi:tetratricopeptide repeat protein [Brevibacillus sp. SYP-B805]|uniref:tetratricopeptide repeat protein n=1 Tax=Brevibacillus sp. SYP-B805 TaxID=1578199 RepID=UPI0013EDB903|nr:tetratricopeptide repeat protein [Brevibacillus sp. SYP-B805]NGQ94553.1 tetratricopeptide repeat protein [Brevibacillus sp. SYP-B805]
MPKKWMYVIDQAVQKIESNEIELGLQALRKVQEHGKDLPEVMAYLADVWFRLGHLAEASAILTDLLQRPAIERSLRQECQLLQAEIALTENDSEKAQELLYQLKEEGCDEPELYLLLADLYAMQDLDEVAVKYLEMAHVREPDNDELSSALADYYLRVGRQRDALQLLEKVSEPTVDALLFKGRMLAQNGEFEQAYAAYKAALALDTTPEILYGCGLMAFHLGALEEAREHIEKMLALDEEYMAGYPLLSDIYLSLGKTEKAIQTLKEYVDLSGFDLELIRRLIALLQQAGRYEEAKVYQKLHDDWNTEDE